MGFDDKGIVALSGAHTIGRAFKERSGTVKEGYGEMPGFTWIYSMEKVLKTLEMKKCDPTEEFRLSLHTFCAKELSHPQWWRLWGGDARRKVLDHKVAQVRQRHLA